RLLGVLDRRLQGRAFIAGDDYTIADMAAYPWINPYTKAPLDLEPYPEVRRWHASIAARPATQRAYALTRQVNPNAGKPLTEEERKHLFGRRGSGRPPGGAARARRRRGRRLSPRRPARPVRRPPAAAPGAAGCCRPWTAGSRRTGR